MKNALASAIASLGIALSLCATTLSQSSTGSISGTVVDQNNAVISGATVTAKNTATGFVRTATTNSTGLYRLVDIPTGRYDVTIDAPNFSRYVQNDVTLEVSQDAIVNSVLDTGKINAVVTVSENASMLNKTTAEVSTRFDSRRLSELPTSPNRNVLNVIGSVPGVTKPVAGQAAFVLGATYSANGGRIRSNNFLLDGQDINDSSLTGAQIPLNNPDAFQEVRVVTNQFLPEYGRNAASVVNLVGKAGTNDFHGSAFWFHNNENLNACSNTDKRAGFCDPKATDSLHKTAPPRSENQIGFTLGGPVVLPRFGEGGQPLYIAKDKTFFFVDYQRWSDRSANTLTLIGAPTAAGLAQLQLHVGTRPHVQELLRYVSAATPNPDLAPVTVTIPTGSFSVERGNLTATSNFKFDSDQGSFRVDHLLNKNNLIYGRYRYSYENTTGTGQIVPAGLSTRDDRNAHAASVVWSSFVSAAISNEVRVAWKRLAFVRDGENPEAKTIPAIQITELGLTGGAESESRRAFGLATNLPVIRANDTYQVTESISILKGNHSLKFGIDLRRWGDKTFIGVVGRGNLVYSTLSNFVNDIAQTATKSLPIRGGESTNFYKWTEVYAFAQDQWRVRSDLTLTYGIRYEYPGDTFSFLREVNERIVAANNNDAAYQFKTMPDADRNNWMPRVGFNWNPKTSKKGLVGFFTGGDKLVLRGGYSRAYDAPYNNINQNIFLGFPFTAPHNLSGNNAFRNAINLTVPSVNLANVSRGAAAEDFRAPVMDQISIDFQREVSSDVVIRIGYIHNRGTALLQPIDGNPRLPCPFGTGPGTCNTTRIDRNTGADLPSPVFGRGLTDPTIGNVNVRSNAGASTYNALQISLEKRLSRGVSFGLHYTWSSFLDTSSDAAAASLGDLATAQDPFDRNANWGRSSWDRPHNLNGNIVYELPFFQKRKGFAGLLFGGWQINSFFNFTSGAPFTPLNGTDPAGANALAPGTIRPNIFSDLEVSRMTVTELYLIDQRLRSNAIARAQQIYNGLSFGPGQCLSSAWLPGPALPFTLFTAPRGRIVCTAGVRSLDVIFNGILEGQRVGNAGRNILRSDGYNNVDLGIIKNTQISETVRVQLWVDLFNAFNWRNFGIPATQVNDPGFLNQWATDGGNRRIRLGVRVIF